jgi:ABC-2 type transport system permease protein
MMKAPFKRMLAMARKEIFHIVRDPFTMSLALVLPAIIVVIFGMAIEFDLTSIPTSFLDFNQSSSSRSFANTFKSSNYFLMNNVRSPAEGFYDIESDSSRALVIVPPDFEKNLQSGQGTQVQILIDAADNASASSILGYLGQIQRKFLKIQNSTSNETTRFHQGVQLKTRYLFNPELSSKWFSVPGLAVVVMAILSILLTSLTVAREWETGSMELLLSTPIQPLEVILGKLLPYGALCMIAVSIVYVLARCLFGVPFVGNHFVFLLGCFLFLVTYLAGGLLISITVRKQTIAMQLAIIVGMLPSQLLSGFIFPVESMPKGFQYFTMILPARWFMDISRACFLQGSTLWELRVPFLALTLIGIVLIAMSVRRFKKDLEP